MSHTAFLISAFSSRFTHDRAEHILFALAVENCISGDTSIAARVNEETTTQLCAMRSNEADESSQALVNGSILKIFVKPMFEFRELEAAKAYALSTVLKPARS
jgi:hypothetical protein